MLELHVRGVTMYHMKMCTHVEIGMGLCVTDTEGIVHDKLHVTCTMSCRFRNKGKTVVIIFINCFYFNKDND